MAPLPVSFTAGSYPGSAVYLAALRDLLAPRLSDWSLGIEIDIPPFSTWERVLAVARNCQDLCVPFYLDDLCMMADLVEHRRQWPAGSQLDELCNACPDAFRGVRLHTPSQTHEVTPNHYQEFLQWNASHRLEVQLVVDPAKWPGSDWERTTRVFPQQPWTILAHCHPSAQGPRVCAESIRRIPSGGAAGHSFHLDHPSHCSPTLLVECLETCLEHDSHCVVLTPLDSLVDNPGSGKLPPDLHSWPLFNMVDALRPEHTLELTPCGEALMAFFADLTGDTEP